MTSPVIGSQDYYRDAKLSTERVNTLNDMRRYWVRIELACIALIGSYYQNEPSEKPLVTMLNRVLDTAKARISAIDEDTTEALANHERIMQKILGQD